MFVGTCIDQINGYDCECISGYGGSQCQSEINECASQPCQNGGVCNEQFNGFNCSCPIGFNGTFCENNINECADQPCLNFGKCVDGINTYRCDCLTGISGINCEIIPSNPSVSNGLNFPMGNVITNVYPQALNASTLQPQTICFPVFNNLTDCRYPDQDLANPRFSGTVQPMFVTWTYSTLSGMSRQCTTVNFESLFYLVVRAALPLANCSTYTDCEPLNALVFKDCNETSAQDWWKTNLFIALMATLAGLAALVVGAILYFTYYTDNPSEAIPPVPGDPNPTPIPPDPNPAPGFPNSSRKKNNSGGHSFEKSKHSNFSLL